MKENMMLAYSTVGKLLIPHGVRHAQVREIDLRCKIEAHHHEDIALYRRALQLREKRMIIPGQS